MNSDSEEDFEATYKAGDEDEDGDVGGKATVKNVVVPSAISQLMDVPPFIRSLDLDTMHVLKFFEYANIGAADPENGEFRIRMEYSSRNLIRKKGCWETQKYNGRHTCTMGMISHDHSKLDSDTVVEATRPLVETDPSMKILTKLCHGGSRSWFRRCLTQLPNRNTTLYNGSEEADGVRILHRILWSFNPCIRAFKYYKPLVQVDGTHFYEKYKGALLVALAMDSE
ncbi:hypothetical protein Ahy_B01g052454 [Arachis hypogaea]|uniref:Uncharacterized protein n=1 Tax=Arachis hypogaea TaxID=3818 RepID=A0A445APH3_ARAHY|nr:hypothetical protein Ahy_B01g052454 [Arachis hypogaea]